MNLLVTLLMLPAIHRHTLREEILREPLPYLTYSQLPCFDEAMRVSFMLEARAAYAREAGDPVLGERCYRASYAWYWCWLMQDWTRTEQSRWQARQNLLEYLTPEQFRRGELPWPESGSN